MTLVIPSLIPLLATTILFFIGMFGHLNFMMLSKTTIRWGSAVIGGAFGFSYMAVIFRLTENYNIDAIYVHHIAVCGFILITIISGLVSRYIIPNVMQLLGLAIYGVSAYFLLA